MNTFGKKCLIALFGLMAIGAIGGVMVAGYAVVIQEDKAPDTSSAPSVVPTPAAQNAS